MSGPMRTCAREGCGVEFVPKPKATRQKCCSQKCRNAYNYAKNREKVLTRKVNYRAENRDKIREYNANYHAENQEKIHENKANYHAENQEKICRRKVEQRASDMATLLRSRLIAGITELKDQL